MSNAGPAPLGATVATKDTDMESGFEGEAVVAAGGAGGPSSQDALRRARAAERRKPKQKRSKRVEDDDTLGGLTTAVVKKLREEKGAEDGGSGDDEEDKPIPPVQRLHQLEAVKVVDAATWQKQLVVAARETFAMQATVHRMDGSIRDASKAIKERVGGLDELEAKLIKMRQTIADSIVDGEVQAPEPPTADESVTQELTIEIHGMDSVCRKCGRLYPAHFIGEHVALCRGILGKKKKKPKTPRTTGTRGASRRRPRASSETSNRAKSRLSSRQRASSSGSRPGSAASASGAADAVAPSTDPARPVATPSLRAGPPPSTPQKHASDRPVTAGGDAPIGLPSDLLNLFAGGPPLTDEGTPGEKGEPVQRRRALSSSRRRRRAGSAGSASRRPGSAMSLEQPEAITADGGPLLGFANKFVEGIEAQSPEKGWNADGLGGHAADDDTGSGAHSASEASDHGAALDEAVRAIISTAGKSGTPWGGRGSSRGGSRGGTRRRKKEEEQEPVERGTPRSLARLARRTSFLPPQAPLHLKAKRLLYDSVELYWERPVFDGGTPIIDYVIEYTVNPLDQTVSTTNVGGIDLPLRPASGGEVAEAVRRSYPTTQWALAQPVHHTGAVLFGLQGPRRYTEVTVRAKNGMGLGPASNVISFRLPDPAVPSAPMQPHIEEVTSKSFTMSWSEPFEPGGCPIIEYEISFLLWSVNMSVSSGEPISQLQQRRTALPALEFTVDKLPGNTKISDVRVAAITAAGIGPPSRPCGPFLTLAPGKKQALTDELRRVLGMEEEEDKRVAVKETDFNQEGTVVRADKAAYVDKLRRQLKEARGEGTSGEDSDVQALLGSESESAPTPKYSSPLRPQEAPSQAGTDTSKAPTDGRPPLGPGGAAKSKAQAKAQTKKQKEKKKKKKKGRVILSEGGIDFEKPLYTDYPDRRKNPLSSSIYKLRVRDRQFLFRIARLRRLIAEATAEIESLGEKRRGEIFLASGALKGARDRGYDIAMIAEDGFDAEEHLDKLRGRNRIRPPRNDPHVYGSRNDNKLRQVHAMIDREWSTMWAKLLVTGQKIKAIEDEMDRWRARRMNLEEQLTTRREQLGVLRQELHRFEMIAASDVGNRRHNLHLRKTWSHWRNLIEDKKRRHAKIDHTTRLMLNLEIAAGFRTWVQRVKDMQAEEFRVKIEEEKARNISKGSFLLERVGNHRLDIAKKTLDTIALTTHTRSGTGEETASIWDFEAVWTPPSFQLPEFVYESAAAQMSAVVAAEAEVFIPGAENPLEVAAMIPEAVLQTKREREEVHPYQQWLLGTAYMQQKQYKRALDAFSTQLLLQQRMVFQLNTNDPRRLALRQRERREFDEKTEREWETERIRRMRILVLRIADCYHEMKEHSKAVLTYHHFLKGCTEAGDVEGEGVAMERLAREYCMLGSTEAGVRWAANAVGLWAREGRREDKIRALRRLEAIYRMRVDTKNEQLTAALRSEEEMQSKEHGALIARVQRGFAQADLFRQVLSVIPSAKEIPVLKLEQVSWTVPKIRETIEQLNFALRRIAYDDAVDKFEFARIDHRFKERSKVMEELLATDATVVTYEQGGIKQRIHIADARNFCKKELAEIKEEHDALSKSIRAHVTQTSNCHDSIRELQEELDANMNNLVQSTLMTQELRCAAFYWGNMLAENVIGRGIGICTECEVGIVGTQEDVNIMEQRKLDAVDVPSIEDIGKMKDRAEGKRDAMAAEISVEHKERGYVDEEPDKVLTCDNCGRTVKGKVRPGLGRMLAVSRDTTVILHDIATGRCERVIAGDIRKQNFRDVRIEEDFSVAFDKGDDDEEVEAKGGAGDGEGTTAGGTTARTAGTGVTAGKAAEYDVQQGHGRAITCMWLGSFVLATGSADCDVRLWEPRTGRCIRTLSGHTATVRCISVSPNQRVLMSGAADNTARLWRMATGVCIRIIKGHELGVRSCAISFDFCATGGEDGLIVMGNYDEREKMGKRRLGAFGSRKTRSLSQVSGDGASVRSGLLEGKSGDRKGDKKPKKKQARGSNATGNSENSGTAASGSKGSGATDDGMSDLSSEFADSNDEFDGAGAHFFGLDPEEGVEFNWGVIAHGVESEARDEARERSWEAGIRMTKPATLQEEADDVLSVADDDTRSARTRTSAKTKREEPVSAKQRLEGIDIRKGVGRTLGKTSGAFSGFQKSVVSTAPEVVQQKKAPTQSGPPPKPYNGKVRHSDEPITAMGLSGPWLITCTQQGGMVFWDTFKGVPLRELRTHDGLMVNDIKMSPKRVMTTDAAGVMEVYDLLTGERLLTLRPSVEGARLLSVAFDDRQLIACFSNAQVRRWSWMA